MTFEAVKNHYDWIGLDSVCKNHKLYKALIQ